METFVVVQLRAEAETVRLRYRLSHLREQDDRHEVDIIVELGGGRIVCVEITAASGVGRSDARHLIWLREKAGHRFAAGVAVHTGRDTFEIASSSHSGCNQRLGSLPLHSATHGLIQMHFSVVVGRY